MISCSVLILSPVQDQLCVISYCQELAKLRSVTQIVGGILNWYLYGILTVQYSMFKVLDFDARLTRFYHSSSPLFDVRSQWQTDDEDHKYEFQVYLSERIHMPTSTVHFIFVLDTVQTCFSMDDTFFYFVYGFGDVQRLFDLHWAFDVPTLDAVIGLVVQGVYCWRIWVLSGWRIIPIFSALVSLCFSSIRYDITNSL